MKESEEVRALNTPFEKKIPILEKYLEHHELRKIELVDGSYKMCIYCGTCQASEECNKLLDHFYLRFTEKEVSMVIERFPEHVI